MNVLKAPSSKLQARDKHQATSSDEPDDGWSLEFGVWSLSGAWRLVLGAFLLPFSAFANTTASQPLTVEPVAFSIVRIIGALFLVIALFFVGAYLFRNWQRVAARGTGAKLNVLEAKSLGARHAIYVVGYEQQRLLLASSPAGITMLTHLPEADPAEEPAEESKPAAAPAPAAFAEALFKSLARK
jgi:flagellar biogenesis protein FliO